eukprot:5345328-Pleurochrysis_carterae.AAC.1
MLCIHELSNFAQSESDFFVALTYATYRSELAAKVKNDVATAARQLPHGTGHDHEAVVLAPRLLELDDEG